MADEVDIANALITTEIEFVLGNRQKKHAVGVASKECKECGETIPTARRQLGYWLCIECAEETERRESLFADY